MNVRPLLWGKTWRMLMLLNSYSESPRCRRLTEPPLRHSNWGFPTLNVYKKLSEISEKNKEHIWVTGEEGLDQKWDEDGVEVDWHTVCILAIGRNTDSPIQIGEAFHINQALQAPLLILSHRNCPFYNTLRFKSISSHRPNVFCQAQHLRHILRSEPQSLEASYKTHSDRTRRLRLAMLTCNQSGWVSMLPLQLTSTYSL
jgi:hypothetical protein